MIDNIETSLVDVDFKWIELTLINILRNKCRYNNFCGFEFLSLRSQVSEVLCMVWLERKETRSENL